MRKHPHSDTDPFDFLKNLLCALGPKNRGNIDPLPLSFDVEFKRFQNDLAAQSEYHGVTLLIESAIRALFAGAGDKAPDAKRAFFALANHHRGLTKARETSIDCLSDAFAEAGIRMILLKGAVLAHLIYRSPELRPTLDIDILIDKADLDQAVQIAKGLGYVFGSQHPSRFAGELHHIPVAIRIQSGFEILLEIHTTALSPNHAERMPFSEVWPNIRSFKRGETREGYALGHTDMLRHLVRHVFEPVRRSRLIHLFDLWRYQNIFRDEIDWTDLQKRFGYVIVALDLVSHAFAGQQTSSTSRIAIGSHEVGLCFLPLSDVLVSHESLPVVLANLFNPPKWWLHGFYGIPLKSSLFLTRFIRHPAMLTRWLFRRAINGIKSIGEYPKPSF